jgi:hypothetical protein
MVCPCCVTHSDAPLENEVVVCRECGHQCSCYGCVAEDYEPEDVA